MNSVEYKNALQGVTPSEKLIQKTIAKVEKQKHQRALKIKLSFQIAAAACFCILVGVGISLAPNIVGGKNNFVGSVFGKGSAWVIAGILFVFITAAIIIIYKRKK